MTFKTLVFCLILYVCLVWVLAGYFHSGPAFETTGLLWTAIGLAAVLLFVLTSRLFGWWRMWHARAASRPAQSGKATPAVDPEDQTLIDLLAEANRTLAKAPTDPANPYPPSFSGFPLFLLIGPEGSGKTSSFLNAGFEPQLLAGEASGAAPVLSTKTCNIWLASHAIFVEVPGRIFSADLNRWKRFLEVLRGKRAAPSWRNMWRDAEPGLQLRGVIAFSDATVFASGASDPQTLERGGRNWQERLRSVADVFGAEFPVYWIISKCDKIRYFPEFFRRWPEAEANQVLGCTLQDRELTNSSSGEIFAEAQAKRLTASFRELYQALAARRLSQLARETDLARRPDIYEFPRELKRVRTPLVQFLTDVFRPRPLASNPVLRGFYLTAIREMESAAAGLPGSVTEVTAPMEATRLFRVEATQLFRLDEGTGMHPSGPRPGSTRRWIFLADLFHSVVLRDRPFRTARPGVSPGNRYRRLVLGGVSIICLLLCLAIAVSWLRNRQLLVDVGAAAGTVGQASGRRATTEQLRSLEALRGQIVRLEDGLPLSFHMGLYAGDRILPFALSSYFQSFRRILLGTLDESIVARLERLPSNPDAAAPYEPVYRLLRAHLMISAGTCEPDPGFASQVLKDLRKDVAPAAEAEWQTLADRQIDFYTTQLPHGNPAPVAEEAEARDRARQYLRSVKGVDRIYATLLANAEKELNKPARLQDLAPNYQEVLAGPAGVSAAFTHDGSALMDKAALNGSPALASESCVTGESAGGLGVLKQDAEMQASIRRLYIRDYMTQWRNFVAGFSVKRYTNAADAAHKLEILSDHRSPLLAVLALTATQTSFTPSADQKLSDGIRKLPVISRFLPALQPGSKKGGAADDSVPGPTANPADITQAFQPVDWVVPPGSPTWVLDKNNAYVDALSQLRESMQAIAQTTPDPVVYQAASQNYEKAMDAVRQIARGFRPTGVLGLDETVTHLLEQPIQLTRPFIVVDMNKAATESVSRGWKAFCLSVSGTLRKYPYLPSAKEDSTLDDMNALFAPAKGALWSTTSRILADFVVKDGPTWKAKDPSKKPQVTQQLLAFLNGAQKLDDVFYPGGSGPQMAYTFRPKLDSSFKNTILELDIDGTPYPWTTVLQKQFNWPSAPGVKELGAVARLRVGNTSFAFASRGGLWGIFRILGDAQPRELSSKLVEWKYTTGAAGRPELITPAPVQMEIVEFPGGVDVFNPKFWETLQCPAVPVQ